MPAWIAFFQAQVGASAALAGLVFVGLSISFGRIIASPHLPNRALEALLILALILGLSSLYLVPSQSLRALGIETLAGGGLIWAWILWLQVSTHRSIEPEHRHHAWINSLFGQIATLWWVLGGAMLLTRGAEGFYWLPPAFLMGYALALFDAWVLLIEVNR